MTRRPNPLSATNIRKARDAAKKWVYMVQPTLDALPIDLASLCTLALAGLNANQSSRRRRKSL
jgi:hypothetical protein